MATTQAGPEKKRKKVLPTAPARSKQEVVPAELLEFKRLVQELNSKTASKLNAIKSQAEKCAHLAEKATQILLDELATCPPNRIIPLASCVDIILKKTGGEFRSMFAVRMPKCFKMVYDRKPPEKELGWLQQILRVVWKPHQSLPEDTLEHLDKILNGEEVPQQVLQPELQQRQQPQQQQQASPGGAAASASSPRALELDEETSIELLQSRLEVVNKIVRREEVKLKDHLPPVVMREFHAMIKAGNSNGAAEFLNSYKKDIEARLAVLRSNSAPGTARRPRDPRQAGTAETAAAAVPGAGDKPAAAPKDPRQKDPRFRTAATDAEAAEEPAAKRRATGAGPSAEAIDVDLDEEEAEKAKMKQILQGLPSIGFSEAWLRQFLEHLPSKPSAGAPDLGEAPSIGRRIVGASGDQMVYVDELSPNEVMLLMQLIFLLEEKLRRSGTGQAAAERIPHTFSYLQVDSAINIMLRRLFNELPFQCPTTGLRFASQEKLRQHTDAMYKRKAQLQQKQRGVEARGWMESISEWVGNRDLVVGPALFRSSDAGLEEQRAQEEKLRAQQQAEFDNGEDEDSDVEKGMGRWICPFDERRSICPLSGEPLERVWSPLLNDWAFEDVVATEVDSAAPLRFHSANRGGIQTLSETAAVFKKSCFFSSTPASRKEALRDCHSALAASGTAAASSAAP